MRAKPPPVPTHNIVCVFLLGLCPYAAFLAAERYPVFHFPLVALALLGSLLSAALILGFLSAWLGSLPTTLVFAVLLTLLIDISLADRTTFPAEVILLAAIGVVWLIWKHVYAILYVTTGGWLLGVLLFSHDRSAVSTIDTPTPADRTLTPIVYIIFDEFMGIDALSAVSGRGQQVSQRLLSVLQRHDFSVYTSAFSAEYESERSLSDILGVGAGPPLFRGTRPHYYFPQVELFERATQAGYVIQVYQSKFMDHCRGQDIRYRKCVTAALANPDHFRHVGVSAWEQVGFITNRLAADSTLAWRIGLRSWTFLFGDHGIWPPMPIHLGSLAALPLLDTMRRDFRADPLGTFFFIHVLFPHWPYFLDSGCRPRDSVSAWQDWGGGKHGQPAGGHYEVYNSPQTLKNRYDAYVDQLSCGVEYLAELLEDLEKTQSQPVVVLHGDHGSRLVQRMPVSIRDRSERTLPQAILDGSVGLADLRSLYSTFLAVRLPGVQGHARRCSISIDEFVVQAFDDQPQYRNALADKLRSLLEMGEPRCPDEVPNLLDLSEKSA